MDKIIARIERQAGVTNLASILADRLSPTDLQSLLLEVYNRRASRLLPTDVLRDFEMNRFVQPSEVSPILLNQWEAVAFTHLPEGFQPLALSPACPLGTVASISPVSQNWSVATERNTEIISDSTNVLAFECALRRRKLLYENAKSHESVHLAASHRLMRAQQYENPNLSPHFNTFALCSASRDQGNLRFEISALIMHIEFYLDSLRAFLGPDLPLHVSITDLDPNPRLELIENQQFPAILSRHPDVHCEIDQERRNGRGYYQDFCFHIHVTTPSGQLMELVDGGCVNWTQKLLSNAKERLVISGIGSERVAIFYSSRPFPST